ncbi:hypothetical protein [Siminovitchia sp. 179-K 8D1 HS]|uniref:hypothetical protein n=1 Tax=Siminovitchia sp. 179-K 8D1 HS TaxID=3142385 RepID=UPI00399F04A6
MYDFEVQITSVNMRYKNGLVESVQVHFTGHDEERTINLNGYIPLTAEEYQGNESIPSLEKLVRQNVSARLMDGVEEGA